MKRITLLILVISLIIFIDIAKAQQTETIPIGAGGRGYSGVSFSELLTNPTSWDNKRVWIYGYYDKGSGLLKENLTETGGFKITTAPDCKINPTGESCILSTNWMEVDGVFHASDTLEAENIFIGKKAGVECNDDSECNTYCLKCPGLKMHLGSVDKSNLPSNAVENCVKTEYGNGCVYTIDPAPDYGFCIVESTDWCNGTWNNNDYITTRPPDTKYLNLIKETLTSHNNLNWTKYDWIKENPVSEEYFNNHMRLVRADWVEESVPVGYIDELHTVQKFENRKKLESAFVYKIDDYEFMIRYDFDTHRLVNNSWVEIDEAEMKADILGQVLRGAEHLMPKDEAFNKLKAECLPNLEETRIDLFNDGIIMSGSQEISTEGNICKYGKLNLETGEIISCGESACYVSAIVGSGFSYKPEITSIFSNQNLIYIIVVIIIIIVLVVIIKKRKRNLGISK